MGTSVQVKRCPKCMEFIPADDYKMSGRCPDCNKKYMKEYYAKNKEAMSVKRRAYQKKNRKKLNEKQELVRKSNVAWMNDIKSKRPCSDCGNFYPPICMDWDHVGEKNFDISRKVNTASSRDRILKEISLCELVCANCHRIRTQDRRDDITKASAA